MPSKCYVLGSQCRDCAARFTIPRTVAVQQANYVEEGKSIQDLFLLHKKHRELNRPFEEDAVRRWVPLLCRQITSTLSSGT